MRSLAFVICFIGSAVCQHWGLPQQVADTPEVAAAKSAHLAALSKAHEQSWSGPEDDGSYRPEHHGESWNNDGGSWNDRSWAPQASQESWAHSGHGDDGSYRAEHHNGPWNGAHSQAHWAPQQQQWAHPQQHWESPQKKWTGPVAYSPGFDKNGAPLPVLDTPEVTAEKSKHFHLYAHGAYAAAVAHQ